MNVAAHQEKETNEETAKREAGEERNSQPISRRRRVALLPLFREQHGEKMICEKKVPGVTGTLGKANSHFNPTQVGLGTALPR